MTPQEISRAMRSPIEIVRQARHLEFLVHTAQNRDGKRTDEQRAAARDSILEREVRAAVRREELRHNISREKGGKLVPNRATSHIEDIVVRTKKKLVPVGVDGALELQDVPVEWATIYRVK